MFSFLKKALSRVSSSIGDALSKAQGHPTRENLESLEQALLEADIGPVLSAQIVSALERIDLRTGCAKDALRKVFEEHTQGMERQLRLPTPATVLVVGINGVGKTTTVAKLAHYFKSQGKKVLVASADTFRAAANEQLRAWGERAGVDLVESRLGADPAAVAFDALTSARARGDKILLIDTAGRLTTKENLMAELSKIEKSLKKIDPSAPNERWLVLDGSLGLNSLAQAQAFTQAVELTGLIVTKLDGSPKGGFLVPLFEKLHLPVYFVGVGEGLEDLRPFELEGYIEGLLP
jgi:fused signal recognition particle receptor